MPNNCTETTFFGNSTGDIQKANQQASSQNMGQRSLTAPVSL